MMKQSKLDKEQKLSEKVTRKNTRREREEKTNKQVLILRQNK